MTKQTTRWRPDTCGCVITYDWDSDLPNDQIVFTVNTVEQACPEHKGLSDQEVFDSITKENTSKNEFLKDVMDSYPSLTRDLLDDDGNVIGKTFKAGQMPEWSFDKERNLTISVPDSVALTPEEKAAIVDAAVQKKVLSKTP